MANENHRGKKPDAKDGMTGQDKCNEETTAES
jgi:hypothetical protein